MIAALDSSFDAPSAEQADQARAAGVRLWGGYLATQSNVGLLAPWTQLAFENARRCGAMPLAFCSGRDDPTAVRELAAAWRVRPCLDVESGIRGDGPWVDAWLQASGAGIYGNIGVHGHAAAFHILAAYPGFDPRATWSRALALPAGPVGWQWQGTHTEFGASVDRLWLDDWFGGDDMLPDERQMLIDVHGGMGTLVSPGGPFLVPTIDANVRRLLAVLAAGDEAVKAQLDAIEAAVAARGAAAVDELDAIKTRLDALQSGGAGSLTAGQQAELDGIAAALAAANKHLGVGTP